MEMNFSSSGLSEKRRGVGELSAEDALGHRVLLEAEEPAGSDGHGVLPDVDGDGHLAVLVGLEPLLDAGRVRLVLGRVHGSPSPHGPRHARPVTPLYTRASGRARSRGAAVQCYDALRGLGSGE